jgi:PAS domain S-box-containing protein
VIKELKLTPSQQNDSNPTEIETAKTILLVEDEAIIAMEEKRILEHNGFNVISAYDADEAIHAADDHPIDLILMDIDLGRNSRDGTEAAAIILAKYDVPIVFLSSHTEPAIVAKTERITSYGYVVKDSGETVLIASIKMAFKLYNAHKEIKEKSNQLDTLLNNAEDYIGRLDSEGRHLYVNQALCKAVGIPYAEYIGNTVTDLGYPPDMANQWNEAIHKVCSSGKAERIEFEFPEEKGIRILDCKIVPELIEEGSVKTVVAVSRDITERKQSEDDLQENEAKFHQLFNTMKEGVAIYRAVDKGNDFIFVDLNKTGLSYGNKVKSNVIGRRVTEVFPGVAEIGLLDIFRRVYKTGKAEQQPLVHYRDEMMEEWVENYVFKLPSGLIVSVYEDTTKSKLDEEKYRTIVQTTTDGFWITDKRGDILEVNDSYCRMSGYSREELLNLNVADVEAKEHAKEIIEHIRAGQIKSSDVFETRHRRKDGSVFPVEISATYFKAAQQFVSFIRDISERKRQEEALQQSEAQKNLILNATREMVAFYDTDLHIKWANKAAAASVGKTMQEMIGMHCYEVWHGRIEPCTDCPVLKARDAAIPFENEQKTPDGRDWYLRGYPILDDANKVTALVEFGMDITLRKKAEEDLKHTIAEKDYLMQELNHRVKNNLALLSSLINLKNTSLDGVVDLSDIKHQIEAIQIVHEKLYKNSTITSINIAEYLSDLISTIFYNFSDQEIEIIRDIEPVEIPTKTVVSLGLIVNEIATNALNHGFADTKDPSFSITMKQEGQDYILVLSNNGREFPAEINLDNPATLGLRLITALVQQIQGTLSLIRGPHPVFTIRFPSDEIAKTQI